MGNTCLSIIGMTYEEAVRTGRLESLSCRRQRERRVAELVERYPFASDARAVLEEEPHAYAAWVQAWKEAAQWSLDD